MDRNTWMALSDEIEPLLRQLKAIAMDYDLKEMPLDIAVFADSNAWATCIDKDGTIYNVNIDDRGRVSATDTRKSDIKG